MEPSSLIIASRNRPQLLADAVESVLGGTQLPTELVVVDQSDEPHGSLRLATAPAGCELRYVWSEERGLSRANNTGIEAARHELLAFTHDDVRVAPDWLESLLAAVRAGGRDTVVTGRVLLEAEPGGFAPSLNTSTVRTEYRGRIGRDVLFPQNMALYRAAVEAVGGFDERLGPGTPHPAAEDNDLAYRLLERGFTIVYEPRAVLNHRAWRPLSEHTRLRYDYGRGQGGFYAKHMRLRDPHMLRRAGADAVSRGLRLFTGTRGGGRRPRDELAYLRGLAAGMARWWWVERT